MSWRTGTELGQQVLRDLLTTLNIDQHWIEEDREGFRWWPSDQCVHIWTEPGIFHNATLTYRVHVETDVIKCSGRAPNFEVELERMMDHTTLNGLVYSGTDDSYKLHSSFYLTEENLPYMKKLFFASPVLQLKEASMMMQVAREKLHAVPATTAHPMHGLRPSADPMMHAAEQFFRPAGAQPSKWHNVPEWRETDFAMEREAERFQSDHMTHLVADFGWHAGGANGPIRLDANTREAHPLLGNGLHFTLTVPLMMTPERVSHLALELNQYERDNWMRAHMAGSWSCHDGQLAYRQFIPNVVYRPELLLQLTLNMSIRAQWTDEFFVEKRRQAQSLHN